MTALAELEAAAAVAEEAERVMREKVRAARAAGVTWEQVGRVFRVKKQTAWERFWRDCR